MNNKCLKIEDRKYKAILKGLDIFANTSEASYLEGTQLN